MPQLTWNATTTRWPISRPRTRSPSATTSATHSCPSANGSRIGKTPDVSGRSMSQRATASGRTSASPSPASRGSGTSRHSTVPGRGARELSHAGISRTALAPANDFFARAIARRRIGPAALVSRVQGAPISRPSRPGGVAPPRNIPDIRRRRALPGTPIARRMGNELQTRDMRAPRPASRAAQRCADRRAPRAGRRGGRSTPSAAPRSNGTHRRCAGQPSLAQEARDSATPRPASAALSAIDRWS